MSANFYLTEEQMKRIRQFFPRPRGVARVDDRHVISGIIYVLKYGLQWKDAPPNYGPHKTLYNRFVRWSKNRVFDRIFAALAAEKADSSQLMIDATPLKAHRTAASPLQPAKNWKEAFNEFAIQLKTGFQFNRKTYYTKV